MMDAEQRTDLACSYLTRKGGACVSSYALISCKAQKYVVLLSLLSEEDVEENQ